MVSFKIHGVIDWKANNDNTHTTHYLKEQRQSDNEISSVDEI